MTIYFFGFPASFSIILRLVTLLKVFAKAERVPSEAASQSKIPVVTQRYILPDTETQVFNESYGVADIEDLF